MVHTNTHLKKIITYTLLLCTCIGLHTIVRSNNKVLQKTSVSPYFSNVVLWYAPDPDSSDLRTSRPPRNYDPFGTNSNSPWHLKNPSNFSRQITYDPATNSYTFQNKIGNINNGRPASMSLEDYLDFDISQSMKNYWRERSGAIGGNESRGIIPQIHVPGEIFENIFGSNLIDIRPSGSIELFFKYVHTFNDNKALDVKNRKQNMFDFDADIQLNLKAKIGDKINYDFNYNTKASFDFENKFKLAYQGKEDDIIKVAEFGNVNMPLSSSLIQGSQTLFGGKLQMQFGKLMLTTVIARQDGEKKSITISGGSELNTFDFRADEYEDNKHFFLAQYFYDHYNEALETLPLVNSKINITKIEVWRTNIGAAVTENRNIIAIADLGEPNPNHKGINRTTSREYPDSNANDLLNGINYSQLRDLNTAFTYLKTYRGGMNSGTDFEKVESARLLSSSEYTFNAKLGFISLNSKLSADQVLAVAFQYTILGDTTVYQVGQFSNEVETPNCLVVKLLKSTSVNTQLPMWKLMMKNVYSLNTYQLSNEDFRLNILYRGEEGGIAKGYFSDVAEDLQGIALIRLLGMDRLTRQLEAAPDGLYDFVDNAATDGGTMQSNTGRVYLPLVEPFGKDLRTIMASDPASAEKYAFDSLYTQTKILAQQNPDKNKFYLEGSFKSTAGASVSLGMTSIAEGSVVVTAGGITLQENTDYKVDYNMGTVTITNESYMNSGTPISISVESQNMFSQKKTFFGLNAEYTFNKNIMAGFTVLNLRERPIDGTVKVDFGEEPINNTIWGMNMAYQKNSRWITKILNYLPFYSSTNDSRFQFSGEFANFVPGHSRLRGRGNKADLYIDDFEASKSSYDLRSMLMWKLASTPQGQTQRNMFPEGATGTALAYGYNRALLAWHIIDPLFHNKEDERYFNGSIDANARSQTYSRRVKVVEVFPNRPVVTTSGEDPYISVLDLAFYPNERGPYNYDAHPSAYSSGLNYDGTLANPKSRWGGIMRKLDITDFETSNIEYIEFWMLDPFLDSGSHSGGKFYINLGDISEDILRDGRKSYEHGLAADGSDDGADYTLWGRVPINQSIVSAFDNSISSRRYQDVGYDGLYDSLEREHFSNYLASVKGLVDPNVFSKFNDDPSGDNYHYFRGSDYDAAYLSILDRYKYYNQAEGNSPTDNDQTESYSTQATTTPNMEDINNDNTMSEDERYYQYEMELTPATMNVGENYITDIQESTVSMANGSVEKVKWYQFKVPVRQPDLVVGGISGFSSIRFIRMFLKGFEEPVVLRFAALELVRGDWRTYTKDLREDGAYPTNISDNTSFEASTLSLEENSKRTPIPYKMPAGVAREKTLVGQSEKELNEQSLTLKVINLSDGDARAVYKNTNYDYRRFGTLKCYLHAEKVDESDALNKGDVKFFIRLGSDFTENYYEYEVPFDLTAWGETDTANIWPQSNYINIELQKLIDAKQERNVANRYQGTIALTDIYSVWDGQNKISVVGSPNLGDIKVIMMGLRNPRKQSLNDNDDMDTKSVEVWINELRLGNFEEKGGWAALGQARLDLADFGDISLSASITTAGFGPLESSTYDRSQETTTSIALSTTLQLGKLLPEKWAVSIPLHYDFSRMVASPEYNPLNPDVKLKNDLKTYRTEQEKDSIKRQSTSVVQRQNFNLMNVHKDKGNSDKKDHFWNLENFDISYAYTEKKSYDIDMEYDNEKTHRGSFAYVYNANPKKLQPFSKLKKYKWLQLISDINLYPYPKSFSFETDVYRLFSESKIRNKSVGDIIIEPTFIKAFEWNRDYTLRWDICEGLKADFRATAKALLTDPQGRIDSKVKKDTIWRSFGNGGKMNDYTQTFNASYQIPINKIPIFSFISSNVSYASTYAWTASAEAVSYLGNNLENTNTKRLNVIANFTNLYNKSKYLRKVNQRTFGGSLKDKPIVKKKQDSKTAPDVKNPNKTQQDTVKQGDSKKPQDKKDKKNVGKEVLDNMLRLMMLVKNVSFAYTEGNGINLPGYTLTPQFIGLDPSHNGAPGFLFAFGHQDDDLRFRAGQNGWLTNSDLLNTPYISRHNTNLTMKVQLEPIKDLKIDITGSRTYSYIKQTYYLCDSNGVYADYTPQNTGGFSITTVCIGTLFEKDASGKLNLFTFRGKNNTNSDLTGTSDRYKSTNFEKFKNNRLTIATRLAEYRKGKRADYDMGTEKFPDGYGELNQDVLMYSFLAAYTGRSADKQNIQSPFTKIPLPNWRITYNGITKIPGVNKIFQSINLTHAYTCVYQIGGFATNVAYVADDGDLQDVRDALNNFIPAVETGTIAITESMNPIIGIDISMKNSFQFKMEWKKTRTVSLAMTNFQVTEVSNDELIFGAGYRFKNLKITFDFAGVRRQTDGELQLRLDFSIKNNKTVLRKIEESTNTPSAGQNILSIALSAEYQITKNFFVKAFYNHILREPHLANQFKNVNLEAGVSLKIMLSQM